MNIKIGILNVPKHDNTHDLIHFVTGMAWRDMAWYMIWPVDVWHGILYVLADMAWYLITVGEAWHGIQKCICEFHVLWHCLGLWSRSHVMSVGGPVLTYMIRSQVEGPLHARYVHMYSSCSFWTVTVS